MMRTSKAALFLATVVMSVAVSGQNVLVNGDFELNPPSANGNNVNHSIAPWILGPGDDANVVKVDGPGGYNYGSNGPESDASAPGAGIPQHYLDIVGDNDFYQSFTPECSGEVDFGGFFSTRANSAGSGSVTIRQGVGLTGAIVGLTQPVTLPGGTSQTDPWTPVSFTVPVTAFTTYSFIVRMNNNLNFDNGFVRFRVDCNPLPPKDPCCPPWDAATYETMLFYDGTGSIADPYTLKFVPSPTFKAQMQAYINYVSTVTPATQITIHFDIWDAGTGNTPGPGPIISAPYWATWTAGTTSNNPTPTPTWFTELLQVNHWYMFDTGMYLEGNHTFFPTHCANNQVWIRIQVQTSVTGETQRVMQFRDAAGQITERALDANP